MVTSDRINTTLDELRDFTAERDWSRFHSPKNLAMALAGEAGELLAEFQWKAPEETEASALTGDEMDRVQSEAADVAIYLLLLADRLEFDLLDAVQMKLTKNRSRFPKPV